MKKLKREEDNKPKRPIGSDYHRKMRDDFDED